MDPRWPDRAWGSWSRPSRDRWSSWHWASLCSPVAWGNLGVSDTHIFSLEPCCYDSQHPRHQRGAETVEKRNFKVLPINLPRLPGIFSICAR